jgi:hypothetical protein
VTVKIATRSASGLRAQGTGGQTVMAAYQTIDHYLRRALSPAHADLLAEPNVTGAGGAIDWFSAASATVPPIPLASVPADRRAAHYARLAALVNDIRARGNELKNSSRQGDRLLGQLLLLALEVPGEDCVYALGDQPVLIFWGYLADTPLPQAGIIDRMIAASRKGRTAPEAGGDAEAKDSAAAVSAPAVAAAAKPRYRWLPPVLWGVFGLLCLVIGLDLLAACGLGWPWGGGGLLVNYCSVPTDDAASRALQELENQNALLEGQLERLLGQVTGRQQQCALQPTPVVLPPPVVDPTPVPVPCGANERGCGPAPPPPKKPPPQKIPQPPEMPSTLQIPKNPTDKSFLTGCWGGPARTAIPIMERYCFDKNGEGRVSLTGPGGQECQSAIHASLVPPEPHLVINREASPCRISGLPVIARNITCSPDSAGQTECFEDRIFEHFRITLRRLSQPASR